MNFNDYIIDESDYNFFHSLPEDEKILFLHDLICENAYGNGSLEFPIYINDVDEEEEDVHDYSELVNDFKNKLSAVIDASIQEDVPANVLFVNDKVIINSNSITFLYDALNSLFMRGYILSPYDMSETQSSVFHKQRYCKAYQIQGVTSKFSIN